MGKRSKMLMIRLTPNEKALLHSAAGAETLSAYVRRKLTEVAAQESKIKLTEVAAREANLKIKPTEVDQ